MKKIIDITKFAMLSLYFFWAAIMCVTLSFFCDEKYFFTLMKVWLCLFTFGWVILLFCTCLAIINTGRLIQNKFPACRVGTKGSDISYRLKAGKKMFKILKNFFTSTSVLVKTSIEGKESFTRRVQVPPFTFNALRALAQEGKKRGATNFSFSEKSFSCEVKGEKITQEIL
ncbi:MAG: hypothetical protein WAV23_03900 [Minisyncoccia bacterium]